MTAAAQGAKTANPASASAKDNKPAKAQRGPLTEEQKKQRVQITIISFNLAVALTAVVMSTILQFGIVAVIAAALAAGAVVAGVVWVVRG